MRRLFQPIYGLYSAVAVLATVVAFAPFVFLLPTLALRRRFGRMCVRTAMALSLVPVRVRGREHLPPGACIVVSNHASYLDGPLLTAALPGRFTFVVQHGAAHWPFLGPVIRRMGVTFVDRGAARTGASQTRMLIRRLEQGQSLTIFPEGTFKGRPGLLAFRKGAFLMASHAGVPVVPAVIRGSRALFGEGSLLLHWSAIHIEFFAPLRAPGDHRHAAPELLAAARAAVLAHCGEPDAARDGAGDE
jgi:1-acyl-sn-glycerol-3-phosphate acyltransferase